LALLSTAFLALLLTAVLLGGMVFFSFGFAPLVFAKLPAEVAGRFIRQVFPFYYGAGAVLALAAAPLAGLGAAGLLLGATGIAFLVALVGLMPQINRARDRGLAGDAAAERRFARLHRASVALNMVQLGLAVLILALLAVGPA
jgi:hypothetical protein